MDRNRAAEALTGAILTRKWGGLKPPQLICISLGRRTIISSPKMWWNRDASEFAWEAPCRDGSTRGRDLRHPRELGPGAYGRHAESGESRPRPRCGDPQQRSFLVLNEGGHFVATTQPVSQEEIARHRVSGAMMRLAPSADGLGSIARLLEEGTIRPDVATVYPLQDAARAWEDIAGNLSPSGPGAARRRPHGKIVLRVA
jgi:Zinc-binding dehydrogenase